MQDSRDEEHKARKTGQRSHVGAQGTRRQFYHVYRGRIPKVLCGARRIAMPRLAGEFGFLHAGQRQAHISG